MLYNYISKEKEKNKTIPECNKIFAPGNNLSNYQPDSDDEITPRKKPNKYLNLSEERMTEAFNETNETDVEENEIEENVEKDKSQNNNSVEEDVEDDKMNSTEQEINQNHTNEGIDNKLEHKREKKPDEIMQMSDFRSDSNK